MLELVSSAMMGPAGLPAATSDLMKLMHLITS